MLRFCCTINLPHSGQGLGTGRWLERNSQLGYREQPQNGRPRPLALRSTRSPPQSGQVTPILFRMGFSTFAVGVSGAGHEPAEAPDLDDHWFAAIVADLVRFLLQSHPWHRLGGVVQRLPERPVELAQHWHPSSLPPGYRVQFLLHACREIQVHHVGKILRQQIGQSQAQRRREQPALLAFHVVASQEGADGRSVRAWAPDPSLLHCLDQRRLREPRRRLGEMLIGRQPVAGQRVSRLQSRKGLGVVGIGILVAPLQVDGPEPSEFQHRPGRPEVVHVSGIPACRVDVNRGRLGYGVRHLARQHPFPDQGVEPQLLGAKVWFQRGRVAVNRRRADGLMCLLGRLGTAAVHPRLVGPELLAIPACDILPRLVDRRRCYLRRIGPHVRDEADRPSRAHVKPFVQLLRHGHRPLGSEPELAPCLLLHGAGGERRRRTLS